ncbi:hypothetical protein F7P69_18945 [Cellulosimicrobium funkei]|nr:hypothetical protein [Cellulosimicrobium funkei]
MARFPQLDKLNNWPDPQTIRDAATDLNSAGEKYETEVDGAKTEWSSVADYYQTDTGLQIQLAGAFNLPADRAENLATAMGEAKTALNTWAGAIEGLETRNSDAQAAAAAFPGALTSDDPAYQDEIDRINGLINGVVTDYETANETCAQTLTGITVPIANEHGQALGWGGITTGYFETILGQVHYEYKPPTTPTFSRREFLRGLPNLAQGLDPDGRPVKLEVPEPDFNRDIQMTHTGTDADGNRLRQPNGIRIGGGALSVLAAGFTFASERQKAEERLLQENPNLSEEELENEVGQETIVRGGTAIATGVATGAIIGSVVPGAGTLVGAGVGLVIGTGVAVALELSGWQDNINDFVMDGFNKYVPEGIQEGVGEAGDFVGDLVTGNWGELFD